MNKLVVAGVCVLALGGGGWALAQVVGPQIQQAMGAGQSDAGEAGETEDEDEVSGFTARNGGDSGGADHVGGGGDEDGPVTIHDGEVTPSGGIAMPHLRPGLWEVTANNSPGGMSAQTCLDMAIQEEFSLYGSQLHSPFCQAATEVSRAGAERWTYTNTCVVPDVLTMHVNGVIEGDLRTRYTHTMNTRSVNVMGGTDSDSHVERGRYVGPCPANVSPGDVMMNGVVMMNVRQVMDFGQLMMPGAFGGMPDSFTPAPDVE